MIDYTLLKDAIFEQVIDDGTACETCPYWRDESCGISHYAPEHKFQHCQGCEFVMNKLATDQMVKGAA